MNEKEEQEIGKESTITTINLRRERADGEEQEDFICTAPKRHGRKGCQRRLEANRSNSLKDRVRWVFQYPQRN
jgi:hypothetical protein